ncbi:MAG: hypothetical protein KJ718_03750 [Nanoarchaeota archaeon]|nr:hypothetical protein [Nanoarchaeota archaeon]MBU1051645.1 hypothetical protein [Nanoarchaeota archaeon]
MTSKGFVWECECGNIEYGQYPPQECSGCQAIESFIKVPEEMVEEKVKENVLSLKPGEEDEEDD